MLAVEAHGTGLGSLSAAITTVDNGVPLKRSPSFP